MGVVAVRRRDHGPRRVALMAAQLAAIDRRAHVSPRLQGGLNSSGEKIVGAICPSEESATAHSAIQAIVNRDPKVAIGSSRRRPRVLRTQPDVNPVCASYSNCDACPRVVMPIESTIPRTSRRTRATTGGPAFPKSRSPSRTSRIVCGARVKRRTELDPFMSSVAGIPGPTGHHPDAKRRPSRAIFGRMSGLDLSVRLHRRPARASPRPA